jgi:glycosyltransferase involved in cell wall biosynthesis
MKIVYVSNSARIPSRDANSVHLMKMCSSYASMGHQVTLFVSKNMDKDLAALDIYSHYGVANNFKIRRIPLPSNKIGSFISTVFITPFLIFLTFPDLVHSRNLTCAWSSALFFRLPVIMELHNVPDGNSKALKMFRLLVQSKKNKGIIVITKALSDYIKHFIANSTTIFIAPDGVDETIISTDFDSNQIRKELEINTDGKKIAVYTGHLYPGRGIELILELAQRVQNYNFYIIGGTIADVAYWKKQSSTIDNIVYFGFQPPGLVYKFQRVADVLLMPYANVVTVAGLGNTAAYASPLKMFEYMAAGRAILSSKLTVLEEILEHESNALMLDYSKSDEWVLALEKLDSDPSYGMRLGNNAQIDVEKFTWQKRAKKILDYFM